VFFNTTQPVFFNTTNTPWHQTVTLSALNKADGNKADGATTHCLGASNAGAATVGLDSYCQCHEGHS
jgi:hypothetical protein